MLTAASRLFLGIALFAVAAMIGHVTAGDAGLYGTAVFSGLLVTALLLGVAAVSHRDWHVELETPGAGPAPSADQPVPASAWPAVAALAAGFLVLGAAAGAAYLALGIALAGVAALEWGAQSWSEGLSADRAYTQTMRNQIMLPLEIPIGVAALAATSAIAMSRLFLAVSATGAVVVAAVVAIIVLAVGSAIALRPRMPRRALAAVGVIAAAAVLASGVIGIAAGEREFHEEHGSEGGAAGERAEVELGARDITFDETEIEVPAGEITITFDNEDDGVSHNLHVMAGADDFATEIEPGPITQTLTFTIEEPGTYTFICDVHPTQMTGDLIVT
jgi:plastocyanin